MSDSSPCGPDCPLNAELCLECGGTGLRVCGVCVCLACGGTGVVRPAFGQPVKPFYEPYPYYPGSPYPSIYYTVSFTDSSNAAPPYWLS